MAKFDEIDSAILASIASGRNTFGAIVGDTQDMARKLATPDRYGRRDHRRVIDRRLQAMRKKGVIAYSQAVWRAV